MDGAGGEIELHLFEGEGHGFFNYRAHGADADRPHWRYGFVTAMEITAGFLDRHLQSRSYDATLSSGAFA